MKAFVVLLCSLFMTFASGVAVAQSSSSGALHGFTSIDYDYDTDTVLGYSETDLDYDVEWDYDAYVGCIIYDDTTGASLTSGWAQDNGSAGWASVLVEGYGTRGDAFRASGIHKAIAVNYYYEDDDYFHRHPIFWDTYYFSYFTPYGIYSPVFYDWYGPGPQSTAHSSGIQVGRTYDSDTVQTAPNYQYSWQCTRRGSNSDPYFGTCSYDCYLVDPSGYYSYGLLRTPLYRIQQACAGVTGCPYSLRVATDSTNWAGSHSALVRNSCQQNPQ